MPRPDKLELIDMAIGILEQAKNCQKSLEILREKLEINYDNDSTDSLWAKHCYHMIRAGIGIIEINTHETTILSHRHYTTFEKDYEE